MQRNKGFSNGSTSSATWLLVGSLVAGCGKEAQTSQTAAELPSPSTAPKVEIAVSGARMHFEQRSHDFGKVSDLQPLVHAFAFENTGDSLLAIQEVSTSCGCTAANLARKEFAPGESESIEVRWKPEGFGRQNKTVTIVSNSAGEPSLKLEVSASIQPHLVLTPARVLFGAVSRAEPHTAQVQLSTEDRTLAIQSIKTSSHFLEAELTQEIKQGRGVLQVTLRENAPWGMFMPKVELEVRGRTADSGEDIVYTRELSVGASLYNEVFLEPAFFSVGHVARGASFRSEIALSRRGDQPFRVIAAELSSSTMPGVHVNVIPQSPTGAGNIATGYKLVLSGQSGDYTGPLRGQVRLETDVPGDESHDVAFMGVVR